MEEKIMPRLAVLPTRRQQQPIPTAPAPLLCGNSGAVNHPPPRQPLSTKDAISPNAPALLSLHAGPPPARSASPAQKHIYILRPQVCISDLLLFATQNLTRCPRQKRKLSATTASPKRGRGMAKDKQEKLQLMEAGKLTLAEAVPGKDRAAQNKKAEYRKMLKPVSRVLHNNKKCCSGS